MTAMDYRQYDSAIGRFNSIDVMSEMAPDWTPYRFAFNNPIFFGDPTGLFENTRLMVPSGPGTKVGQVHQDQDGKFVWNGTNWIDECGGAVMPGNTEIETVVVKSPEKPKISEGPKQSVGQPGALESAIPFWGSGRAAVDHFQNGNYWEGTFYTALAISDVFLVKSMVTGLARGGFKLLGSNSWSATRQYYLKSGFAKPYQPLHHWLIQQNGRIGKHVPNIVKNQMWNLKSFSTASMHMRAGHGYNYMGQKGFGIMGQLWYGIPEWPKLVIGSYGGRLLGEEFNDDENNDGEK